MTEEELRRIIQEELARNGETPRRDCGCKKGVAHVKGCDGRSLDEVLRAERENGT